MMMMSMMINDVQDKTTTITYVDHHNKYSLRCRWPLFLWLHWLAVCRLYYSFWGCCRGSLRRLSLGALVQLAALRSLLPELHTLCIHHYR